MNSLTETVKNNFGLGPPPSREDLVHFDGFDELDKNHAIEVFLGKTTEDVARALSENRFGTQSDIEDIFVMEPAGYQYYLAPYLIQVLRNETDDSEDLQLAGFVISTVSEIIRVRGVVAFTQGQIATLLSLCSHLVQRCEQEEGEDIWAQPLLKDLKSIEARLTTE